MAAMPGRVVMAVRKKSEERLPTAMARAIYRTRAALNMSVGALAAAIGATHPTVCRLEAGGAAPTLLHLLRIGAMANGEDREFFIRAARLRVLGVVQFVDATQTFLEEVARGR
jgi:predicted transcriptional regulator